MLPLNHQGSNADTLRGRVLKLAKNALCVIITSNNIRAINKMKNLFLWVSPVRDAKLWKNMKHELNLA
jgi:hypothetical protein